MSTSCSHVISLFYTRHRRVILAVFLPALILISLFLLHAFNPVLDNWIADQYTPYLHLVKEFVVVLSIIAMMWYYYKTRLLLLNHAIHENQLKTFIKYTPAAVAMVDKNMCYLAASDRWLHDFHVHGDILGKSHYDVFSEIQDLPRWKSDHLICLGGEKIHREEDSFIGLNGEREWIRYDIIPWRNPDNTIGGLIFMVEFITERVRALHQLRESEERFERIMRGTNDGVFDWNVAKNHVYFSQSFKNLMGYPEGITPTVEGWAAMLHPEDYTHTMNDVEAHLKHNKPYDLSYRLRHKDGHYIWITARGQAEWDENGDPTYFSGIMMDVSEKKRLEELKNEFVYVVTHELRTPLSALRGALDMLPRLLGEDLPEKAKRSLELSLQGCDRLSLLVNDLLEVGKIESGTMEYHLRLVETGNLLQQVIDMNIPYAEQFNVTLKLENNFPNDKIFIDAERLHQILANLISNAVKFSPDNGIVILSTAHKDKQLVLSVTDHGNGIPTAFQERIFQKFARSTTDKPGTGLGLNITKTMVEKMGGMIWFTSEEGKGTVFFVSFPVI